MASKKDGFLEEELEDYYFENAKKGIVLTVDELVSWCKDRGMAAPTRSSLRNLRNRWKHLAAHSRFSKPASYMGAMIDKPGQIQIDMFHFKPELSAFNAGCKYFLVGRDVLSQKIACYPCTNKKQTTWEQGVAWMIKHDFPHVQTITTDRDSAVTGTKFQKKIKELYDIDWDHLRSRSKAYAAENGGKLMKTWLSTGLDAKKAEGKLDPRERNNWVGMVQGIVDHYNSLPTKGSTMPRRDVNKSNYLDMLAQRFGAKDPTPLMNLGQATNFSPKMAGLLFRYPVGQKVLLARSANYSEVAGAFNKHSVRGSFGLTPYVVTEQVLKSGGPYFLTPCYRLANLQGLYYQRELRALQAGSVRTVATAAAAAAAAAAVVEELPLAATTTTTTTTTTAPPQSPRRSSRIKKQQPPP